MRVLVINSNDKIVHNLANAVDGDLEYLFGTSFMGPGQIQVVGTGFNADVAIVVYGAADYQQKGSCPIVTINFAGHDPYVDSDIVIGKTSSTSSSIFIPADFATGSLAMKVTGTTGIITQIRITGRD